MKTLSLSILALALSAPLALAQTSGEMDHSQMQMSDARMEGAVHTTATLNSIGDGTVNVSHDPIPEIGWPAMTMDFALTSEAQMLGGVSAGDKVTLMLIKGEDGMYAIGAMMPE